MSKCYNVIYSKHEEHDLQNGLKENTMKIPEALLEW